LAPATPAEKWERGLSRHEFTSEIEWGMAAENGYRLLRTWLFFGEGEY